MITPLIKARGYFWWDNVAIPEGSFAPPNAITGALEISPAGNIELSLDAVMLRDSSANRHEEMFNRGPPQQSICGILAGSNQYVRIADLYPHGGTMASAGPSSHGFVAGNCLISTEPFLHGDPKFRCLSLSVEGYEDWLGLRSIEITSDSQSVTAIYIRPKQHSWKMDLGCLSLNFDLSRPMNGRYAKASLSEQSYFELVSRKTMSIHRAVELASRFEDLMILLTDSELGMDFPTLKVHRRSRPVQLYYPRFERSLMPTHAAEHWARFKDISESFGLIVEKWLSLHEFVGPGLHLYLGNRRQKPMYPEHRFASLIWGLESLNRRIAAGPSNAGLQTKIDRILKQVAEKKDQTWLRTQLRHAAEPSLAMRLVETFSTLPLDLDKQELDLFARHCATRRNEVSHFGGMREPGSYEEFLKGIFKLNEALDLLYHAKILQMIGVPDGLLRWWFMDGFKSHRIRMRFEAVGLTLKTTGSPLPI
jgi:ApeA N-terminal domain 1